ncbi:SMC family ATPase [Candidatus Woesearchaeota archaeon]|nr:SMC family ATPase [Candidatus Woesearchaeota archaeon]
MILKSIRLGNIRSYRSQKIDFPEGSVLLAGDIGSGKSSVLQAVEFALFGARRDSISGDALLRKDASEGDVELNFSIAGSDVVVGRKLRRQQGSVSQDSGYIIIDGRRIDATPTELKARVLALLGYPRELITKSKSLIYRYTVYTPQEEMKQIILESYDQRIDTLRKVFGIDRYKRIAENATLYVRRLKESKRELLGIMQGLDEKKKEASVKEAELREVTRSRDDILPSLDSLRRRIDVAKKESRDAEERMKSVTENRSRLAVLDARLAEIVKARLRNTEELNQIEAQSAVISKALESAFLEDREFPAVKDVEDGVAAVQQRLQESVSQKAGLSERKSQLEKRMKSLKEDIDSRSAKAGIGEKKQALYEELLEQLKDKDVVSKALESLRAKMKELDGMRSELSAGVKASEQMKVQVMSLDTCPTCMQQVSMVHKQSIVVQEERKLKKFSAELEALESERSELDSELKAYSARLDELAEKERVLAATRVELANTSQVKAELDRVMKDRAALDEELGSIISRLERLDDSVVERLGRELEDKRRLLKSINEHALLMKERKHNLSLLADRKQRMESVSAEQDRLKQEVAVINRDKESLTSALKGSQDIEDAVVRSRQALDLLSGEEKRLEVVLGEKGKEIEGIINILKSIRKDIEEKVLAKETYDRFNNVQEWIERMFVNLMSSMERQIMVKVHSQFSSLFSSWFGLLVEDENVSVRIDETFSPQVLQNGYDTSIEHLSGGERTAIALAYRLALNKVINDVMSGVRTRDIIILDEPTDGFSGDQLDKVREVLDQLGTKQTIIVSHEPKIESFVDHVIRIHKSGHVSRVVS